MLALAHTKAASRSLKTHVDDGRAREVGPLRSTRGSSPNNASERAAEVGEGRERTKGNTPERNALRTQSRAGAPSALERVRQAAKQDRKQRFTALLHHVYDVERLRAAYFAMKRDAAAGRRRRNVAALRDGLGGESPGPLRPAEARRVPSEAGASRVHPEGGRAAAAARRSHAGRQDRPACRRRGAERDLRHGLPRVLVWISAEAQSASRAGCADGRHHDEEGELGARCGHSELLRHAGARMAGAVHRAPCGGSARRAAHPEMAERRRAGGGAPHRE